MMYIYPLFSAVLAHFKAYLFFLKIILSHLAPLVKAIGLLDTSSHERPGMKLLVLKCLGTSFY